MRVYGRVQNPYPPSGVQESDLVTAPNPYTWVVVETDASGDDDYVYITALVQVLLLNLGESPFYSNFGIPAKDAVRQQVPPDYYVALTQKYFSQFFASLIISRRVRVPNARSITYDVYIVRKNGSIYQTEVAL